MSGVLLGLPQPGAAATERCVSKEAYTPLGLYLTMRKVGLPPTRIGT